MFTSVMDSHLWRRTLMYFSCWEEHSFQYHHRLPNKPLLHYCSVTRVAAKIAEWNYPCPQRRLKLDRLTRRKSTTKEHVEEILGWDVCFESTVEVCMTVSMSWRVDFLISKLVILLPLLWVAQYCICITNGWNIGKKEAQLAYFSW